MELNVDRIIGLLNKLSYTPTLEMVEQEGSDAGASSDSASATPSSVKKWESGRSYGKTYMNDPKYKWESGRTMGPTYKGDPKHKWYSGVKRGKANPASES